MDPISHMVIGAGLATLSGDAFSWSNPIYLSSMLGSMAPDLDIIFQLKGDAVYLKKHRGFSHSLPGLVLVCLLVGSLVKIIYPGYSFLSLLVWSLVGALSHTLFDIGNSYGAQLLGPWISKKFSLNLIQIFDPILLMIFGAMLWASSKAGFYQGYFGGLILLYLAMRWGMKSYLHKKVAACYPEKQIIKLVLFPSVIGLFSWDYLLETKGKNLVGQVHLFRAGVTLTRKLTKETPNEAISIALKSIIGEMFREFTPHFHISYYTEGTKQIIKFFDLRYLLKREFMHSATVILEEEEMIDAIFHPYHAKRNIHISG